MSSSQQKRLGVIQRLLQVFRHRSWASQVIQVTPKIGFWCLGRGRGKDSRLVQEGANLSEGCRAEFEEVLSPA